MHGGIEVAFYIRSPKTIDFVMSPLYNAFWSTVLFVLQLNICLQVSLVDSQILPNSDENLNIYVLPVGQGDSTIIQCPTGKITILNMGSLYSPSYFDASDLIGFIGDFSKVEQIIISRPHLSTYNLLPTVFKDTTNIKKVYISCRKKDYTKLPKFKRWFEPLAAQKKLIEIRSKTTGEPKCDGSDCTQIKICGDTAFLESNVLAANMGKCEKDIDSRINSLVMHINFNSFTMLLPGDIQDWSDEDDTYLKKIVSHFNEKASDNDEKRTTAILAAGHGDWGRTNKVFFLNAIKPSYIIVSNAVPEPNLPNFKEGIKYTPRCELMDYLANRQGGSVLTLETIQPFQCRWEDESISRLRKTKRAIFLTAYDADDYKVRRIIKLSSNGDNHKVSHIPKLKG